MAKEGRSWFKIGCFGCLGVVGIIVLMAVIVSFAAWMKVKDEKVAERVLDHQLPVSMTSDPVAEPGMEPTTPSTAKPGKVTIDLSNGEFHIKPTPAGTPIHVEAIFDESSYELVEDFDPGDKESWSYNLRFRQTKSSFISSIAFFMGATRPKVDLFLPLGTPMELDLQLSQGGSQVELGGLWLTSAKLAMIQGGLELDIREPLAYPMERLSITGSMGGIEASSLGNASPRFLEVRQNMGGIEVDLRGQWMQDSEVNVSVKMGGGAVRLPRDVIIKGVIGAGVEVSETEADLPTLTISTSSHMGEVEVIR